MEARSPNLGSYWAPWKLSNPLQPSWTPVLPLEPQECPRGQQRPQRPPAQARLLGSSPSSAASLPAPQHPLGTRHGPRRRGRGGPVPAIAGGPGSAPRLRVAQSPASKMRPGRAWSPRPRKQSGARSMLGVVVRRPLTYTGFKVTERQDELHFPRRPAAAVNRGRVSVRCSAGC